LVKGDGIAVSPAFSPDGRYLAYVGDQTGQGQIYVAEASGARARLLTPSAVLNTDPSWSPDGNFIVFVSNETDIYVIKPDGSGLKALTKDQGVNRRPGFSPDGKQIVFSSDRQGDGVFRLYTMNADGSDQKMLLPGLKEPQHAPYWGRFTPLAPSGADVIAD
jgi:TolB protein